jgi:hypothetical protein
MMRVALLIIEDRNDHGVDATRLGRVAGRAGMELLHLRQAKPQPPALGVVADTAEWSGPRGSHERWGQP